ncbi:MAG: cystathionine gamma-lyase, partial [Mesorhizobium sp.]
NTTMTPYGQRPLDLGADIVVAADTKAPNGHSDALFGHVASRDAEIITAIRDWRKLSGSIPGPFEAWLVHRGLETLEVRFDRMCTSAELIARR